MSNVYNTNIDSLDIDNQNVLDEVLINTIHALRKNILSDIYDECIGLPLSKNEEFAVAPNTGYDNIMLTEIERYSHDNIKYHNFMGGVDEENLTIFGGIMKYLTSVSGGAWITAVRIMGAWYQEHVHTYQNGPNNKHASGGRKMYDCDILQNKKAADDCSGFVASCLWYAGYCTNINYAPTSSAYVPKSGAFYDSLVEAGFTQMEYSESSLSEWDIISSGHHVEIYCGEIDGKKKSYGWGNVHDGKGGRGETMPCSFVKDSYKVIWRPSQEMIREGSAQLGSYGSGPAENRRAFKEMLMQYGGKLGLTPLGKALIMAQAEHESGGFKYMSEIGKGKGKKYGKPDGPYKQIYYGRGPIQVTWYYNYKTIYEKFFIPNGLSDYDIVKNPDLALRPDIGSLLSIGWLTLPGNGKYAIAAANAGKVKSLTRYINGGYIGLADRQKRTLAVCNEMGVSGYNLNA